jgi:hypothetical protein
MPIVVTTTYPTKATTTQHEGRVVRIERTMQSRNMSDTLDYTDIRTVECVYALVWTGGEQFSFIDCSNHFAWRGADYLVPTVDETLDAGAVEALPVWEAHQKFLASERAAKAATERAKWEEMKRVEAEREAAKEAKKAAKLEASKAAADADYVMVAPMKGSIVTVAGFTGTLFWIGVKAYRGQYGVRIGVKDAKGNVQWGAAKDLLCVTK